MLRSLFSGISGLRAHQTMLDVTGNNISNVNTAGFKASQTQFQDTLSQVLTNAGGAQQGVAGGTNPAQVGLGVRVAGITTNFQQGSSQLTNRSTDMMINGDGFFTVRNGAEQMYTRAGSFNFDSLGQLVTADGSLVQGWAADADGAVDTTGALDTLQLPITTLMGAKATQGVDFKGNLPSDAAVDTVLNRTIDVYDDRGNASALAVTFTKAATGWTVQTPFSGGPQPMTFTDRGALTGPATIAGGPGVTVDLSTLTGYAGITSVEAASQDGREAGSLQSFSLNADGTLMGSFSNGLKQAIGQIALASFANPTGLSKAGSSLFRTSVNSGEPMIGTAATGGRGSLAGGALEMSNVDLSSEFTSLIIAQRGFQANSRVITTSDELLQELVNLKR
ncbi:flagellar hook protein FlgE [Cellulomonas aerilata]|uniref:Flagellar hook protein FlgE n=1 Tax=Cellulomonas aerilata TaxID=515326 RepID=A0A512DDD3_9CELL|nr:flagellar hook protein FlgE [Cellulomonas aerilata]GEO34482.1 flagellar hook protein FlgE [Cellulomonas aerilata]